MHRCFSEEVVKTSNRHMKRSSSLIIKKMQGSGDITSHLGKWHILEGLEIATVGGRWQHGNFSFTDAGNIVSFSLYGKIIRAPPKKDSRVPIWPIASTPWLLSLNFLIHKGCRGRRPLQLACNGFWDTTSLACAQHFICLEHIPGTCTWYNPRHYKASPIWELQSCLCAVLR